MKYALPIAIAVLVGYAGLSAFRSRVAPTPEVFASTVSLDDGIRAASASGKPVVALVTADWCPPCQLLKRDTLTDPAVAAWLGENAVPVYIDSDANPADAGKLGVSALPTTVVLRDGQILASKTGFADAESYLGFLRSSVE
jgi:thiol:disulfide interchange protein DsbD